MAPPVPPFKDRQLQIRAQAEKWLSHARHAGLVVPAPTFDSGQHRTQGSSSGVSIDWLRMFSDSLKELPLLPTETYAVVRDIVNFSTGEAACRLVDIIPHEHVGYPSYYICHNWNGDFHSMVSALVADFSQRWQAHLTYKLGNKNKDRQQQQQQDRKDLGGKDEDDAAAAAALVQDRKKLAGYYVWIDVAAVNQHHTSQLDVASVSRLVSVIGRTVLMLDESNAALARLWCCYELWLTIKAQRTVLTLHVGSDDGPGGRSGSDSDDEQPEDVADRLEAPDLSTARASLPGDRAAILASLQQDIASPKIKVKSLLDISKAIRNAVASGVVRELQMPKLLQRMYGCLGKCCRVYTDQDVQPGYSQVDSLRKTLRELINQHYRKEATKAKLLPQEDPELETWECLTFLEKEFERSREDDSWLQDVKRFSKLILHSYATRFSNGYVNSLMRQAGTCDDMKALSQFVHSQCRVKTLEKWGSGT